jgi:hypothetical protein
LTPTLKPIEPTDTKRETREFHQIRVGEQNVQATVISHHVIAPERSPRSGNVASTRRTSVRTDPNKLVNTPSRYIELLGIAYTSESPNALRRDGQRENMQMTLLAFVPTVKGTSAGRTHGILMLTKQ